MERLDRKILALLARDGRMSYTDIGRATGLSTSAAQQRVRKLEQRGVITGYHAAISDAAVSRELVAFIHLRPFDPSQADDTPDRIASISEVISCYSIAGDASYLIKVQVENTGALEELLAVIRTTASVSTQTTVVLSIPYEDRPLVSELSGDDA
ncbi:Lrp/AsnC family transcriptional regulator [Propionibacteriaceae bacterium Y1685]|uniref:Lrp/AsnC family transcriptional regulator n=1 Tax=Microlunatus sp. Y1700 TaxID=3418487 RepID=UPI003B78C811